jgi:hypothetical protein
MLSASFVAAGTGTVGLAFAGTSFAGTAMAGSGWHTSGNHSILGGNQIKVPIEIPVNICGNALALLGDAFAGCKGGAHVGGHRHHAGQSWHTSGNHSILGGNQIKVPVKVPVNVCGNSAAVLGDAFSGCKGGAGAAGGGGWHTSGNESILGGNQVKGPVKVPVNVCGNAIALLGDAFAGCKGGAHVGGHHHGRSAWHTSGNESIGGGNQVKVPVKVPVNVCGNSGAGLGLAAAGCKGGAGAAGGGGGWRTSGNESILGGNQGKAAVKAPVNACGNALALLGDAFAGCKGGAHVRGGHHGESWHTSGNNSIGGGNQVKVPVKVPVNVCGNSAAVLGDAFSGCKGGATVDGRSASHGQHVNNVRVAHMSGPAGPLAQPLGSTGIIQQPGGALAGLSSLPVLSSLQAQTAQLTSYSSPDASLLSTGAAAPGMGAGALLGLVVGALLAGAASLVAAGRRLGVRKASR